MRVFRIKQIHKIFPIKQNKPAHVFARFTIEQIRQLALSIFGTPWWDLRGICACWEDVPVNDLWGCRPHHPAPRNASRTRCVSVVEKRKGKLRGFLNPLPSRYAFPLKSI